MTDTQNSSTDLQDRAFVQARPKRLEWYDDPWATNVIYAENIYPISYRIWKRPHEELWALESNGVQSNHDTIEAAKSAAQQHFDALWESMTEVSDED